MLRIATAVFVFFLAGMVTASAEDLGQRYYFPDITSQETFDRVLVEGQEANKEVRVGFTTSITNAQLAAPESPRFVIFAKGAEAEKLIMVALDDEVFKTIYRARAMFAQLTSNVRANFFAGDERLAANATFFDMLQMMEFKSLVVTDGLTWTHKIHFARPE